MSTQEQIVAWYEEYGQAVCTYILMLVRDYQQAEDLTQETFLKAYQKQQLFRQKSSIKTWLFSIAHNTAKDYLRKKSPLHYYLQLNPHIQDEGKLPEQITELDERSTILYKSIQSLKLTYRQVIILRKLKGFSTKETAEILQWSESKVKMTLHRALEALKNELMNGGFSYEAIF